MARKMKKKRLSINEHIKSVFINPKSPASFRGPDAIVRVLKQKNISIDKKTVQKWLQANDAYTLHKPVRQRFLRRTFEVRGIGCIYQADLMDLPALAKYNDNCRYLLTCLDTFSRMAYVRKLKNKLGSTVSAALHDIFLKSTFPLYLNTDKGKEFLSKETQGMLKKNDVSFYTTENETKAMLVERFNRTLGTAIGRYMTHYDTNRYVDVLDNLVNSYNNTYHTTIRCRPSEVTKHNEALIWKNIYGGKKSAKNKRKFKFSIGEQVRISKQKKLFRKHYKKGWTVEVFTVKQRFPTTPPTYQLMDERSEILQGRFYESEMQLVLGRDLYLVEKIIKRRKRGNRKEILVKFANYDSSHNSWIPEAALQEA